MSPCRRARPRSSRAARSARRRTGWGRWPGASSSTPRWQLRTRRGGPTTTARTRMQCGSAWNLTRCTRKPSRRSATGTGSAAISAADSSTRSPKTGVGSAPSDAPCGDEVTVVWPPCCGANPRIDAERERLLHIYLADHFAGSGGGISLAKRIAKENQGNEFGREMSQIAAAIEEDQAALERILESVGARTRRWRQAGAILGERLSRLK